MNPGELNEKIAVLMLLKSDNTYTWAQASSIWAKAEQLTGKNLFSEVGIGVKSIKFTIRKKKDLTLHNAFLWLGKHCFLTNINEINPMYYEVTAALVEPKSCVINRTSEPTKDELNRPVYGEPEIMTFFGCLVEKYSGYNKSDPMTTTEQRYVLVTPKAIEIDSGELITIDEAVYTVLIPHMLDEFKNEYEIVIKGDA